MITSSPSTRLLPAPALNDGQPVIGLALGGGAARGLAHIVVLEVFDELGIRPAMISGASMGAMIGAAYAAGMVAADIRDHALNVLGRASSVARRLLGGGESSPLALLNFSLTRGVLIDGKALLEIFLPEGLAEKRLEELPIPLLVSATDFYAAEEVVLHSGPVGEAVAASIAIPGLIAAPETHGRLLVDGVIVNPVPFDLLQQAGCKPVVAVEVTGQPRPRRGNNGKPRKPGMTDLAIGAMQIMQLRIAELQRRTSPPEIWIDPPLDDYRAYDLLKAREILERTDAIRDDIRRSLAQLLEQPDKVTLPPPSGASA